MENLVTRVCAALRQQGWTVSGEDAAPRQLPQCVSGRYHNPPSGMGGISKLCPQLCESGGNHLVFVPGRF